MAQWLDRGVRSGHLGEHSWARPPLVSSGHQSGRGLKGAAIGSWYDSANYAAIAARDYGFPGGRGDSIGFRLARSSGN